MPCNVFNALSVNQSSNVFWYLYPANAWKVDLNLSPVSDLVDAIKSLIRNVPRLSFSTRLLEITSFSNVLSQNINCSLQRSNMDLVHKFMETYLYKEIIKNALFKTGPSDSRVWQSYPHYFRVRRMPSFLLRHWLKIAQKIMTKRNYLLSNYLLANIENTHYIRTNTKRFKKC